MQFDFGLYELAERFDFLVGDYGNLVLFDAEGDYPCHAIGSADFFDIGGFDFDKDVGGDEGHLHHLDSVGPVALDFVQGEEGLEIGFGEAFRNLALGSWVGVDGNPLGNGGKGHRC